MINIYIVVKPTLNPNNLQEYILRRKMLLRRLDVTIESFLGSSGNANNNNNNKADTSSVQVVSQPVYDMIKTHQRYLEEAPTFYAVRMSPFSFLAAVALY